jgi:hypothetical protein
VDVVVQLDRGEDRAERVQAVGARAADVEHEVELREGALVDGGGDHRGSGPVIVAAGGIVAVGRSSWPQPREPLAADRIR